MKKELFHSARILGLGLCLLLSPFVPMNATEVPPPVDGVLTITVTAAGELYDNYAAADITATGATKLKIVGPLNAYYDFTRIKDVIDETLTQVDLSEAILPDNTLPSSAFSMESTLTTVVLPSNLVALGVNAFYNCTSLTSVNLPSSLNNIDNSFQNCTALTSLDFDVTGGLVVGSNAFTGCTHLESITINAGGDVTLSTYYGSEVFSGCTALQTFELHTPGKLTSPRAQLFYINNAGAALTTVILDAQGEGSSLSNSIFQYCKQLTTVVLPAGLTELPYYFFYECNALTSVTLPTGLTTIGSNVFNGCSSLTSLDFSGTQLSTIDQYAFSGCSSLESISLPSSLTSLGGGTFYQCSSLQSLDLSQTQITSLPNSAFSNCTSLTSVQLPSTINNIGNNAFYYCNSLPSLTLNVTGGLYIDYQAFYRCPQLESISITAGGDVTLGTNSSAAIYDCKALESFILHTTGKLTAPSNHLFDMGDNGGALTTVTLDAQGAGSVMGSSTFYNCKHLTSVTLPAGLTAIPNDFFYYCEALPSVTIPASVTSIGDNAFNYCNALESLDLSQTQVATIGSSAFNHCTLLESVSLPAGITSLGYSVFGQCSSLQSIDLSQTQLTTIPSSAFYNCTSLTSVQLPATINTINQDAFYHCGFTSFNLTTSGALTIGSSAFGSCSSLQSVVINAVGDVTLIDYPGKPFPDCNALEVFEVHTPGKVNIPQNLFYRYPTNALRRCILDAQGAGSTIGDYAFQYNTHLEELVLPAGLTSLGRSAFQDCSSLTSISLPATTTIPDGYYMFKGCSSLQSIDLSQTQVTALGEYAFYGCSSLASVSLPNGFTTISNGMFNGCSSLPAIDLPGSVTTIGQNAFYGCSQLQGIAIPAGVTSMGNEAFRNCTSLTTAIVAGNIGTLPQYTFQNCSSLQSVSLAGSITTIGNRAFDGCSQLRDIWLPSTLTTINEYAFYNCSALSVISLPSSLTTLGTAVFSGCSGLISLEVPEGVSALPQSMFYNCSGMQSLYLPSTITEINYSALDGLSNLIDLHIMATTPPPLSYYSRAAQVTLFVPEASIASYQAADTWKNFKYIYAELTDLATLDDDEFAILQQIYSKTRGSSWTRPWTFGETKADTPMPYGIKVSDSHVRQIALVNNGLVGSLPAELMQFPQVWYVNVSQNHLSGDIGTYFDNMSVNNRLTFLDLSDNQLHGNIGQMGNAASDILPTEKLPNLATFKIARNKISAVWPVLPNHITTLDIRGQEVDFDHAYNFSDFIDCNNENLPYQFPSILTYQHSYKQHNNVHFLLWAPDAAEPWTVYFYKQTMNNSTSSFGYSGSGWNFLPSGSEIYLSDSQSNPADRNRIRLVFDFQMGDINYNGDLDVADLQTLINYAIQPETFQRYTPFNWVAANTIAADPGDEEIINVQDVVAEVNLLLDEGFEPSLARRKNKAHEPYETNGAEAYAAKLSIESGQLVLISEVPVAALDISVVGSSVQWSSDMSLFSRKSRGNRTIFYSLFGDVLSAGRTVLGTVGSGSDITAVSLADAEGQLIAVAIGSGETTGIGAPSLTLPEGKEPQVVYDLQGRRMDGSRLNKGVYIMNGKKQVVK